MKLDRRWLWVGAWMVSTAAVAHAQEVAPARPPPPATLPQAAEPQEEKPMTPAEAELSAAEFDAWPDLQYADDPDLPPQTQCLDLFTPDESPKTRLPVVVWFHGGGWQDGDKRGNLEWKPACFTHAGFVLATVNYRLAPQYLYPDFMLDAARAVAWLHAHAGEYGGDPDRIVVMGHSAGSHIAGLLATDPRWLAQAAAAPGTIAPSPPQPESTPAVSTTEPPQAQASSSPTMQVPWLKGAILVDGGSYDLVRRAKNNTDAQNTIGLVFGRDGSLWPEASPVTHVAAGKGLPPFLLIHAGTAKVNELAARQLGNLLRRAEVPVEQVDAPDQNHLSILTALGAPDDPTTAKVLEFLCKVTGAPPRLPPPAVQPTPKKHGHHY